MKRETRYDSKAPSLAETNIDRAYASGYREGRDPAGIALIPFTHSKDMREAWTRGFDEGLKSTLVGAGAK